MLKKIHRYILGEIVTYFLLCLFLLTFVLFLNRLLQLTDLIINKGVPLVIVGKFLLTIIPVFLVVTLPMSTLVSCIMAFSRLSNDSEFVAMTASGMSLYSQLRPVAIVGAAAGLLSGVIMAFGIPWSHTMANSLRHEILQTHAAAFEIKEQVFNDSFDDLVIYVRKINRANNLMRGILISDTRNEKESQVIFAEHGLLVNDPKSSRLLLRLANGTLHRASRTAKKEKRPKSTKNPSPNIPRNTRLDQNKYQVVYFGSYDLNLDLRKSIGEAKALRPRLRAMPIQDLREKIASTPPGLRRNALLVELYNKFAAPFACLILALLGAPLGVQNRRTGRHGGFALSLAILILYYLFATLTDGLGESGRIPPLAAVWGPNILLLLIALWIIHKVVQKGSVDIFGYLVLWLERVPRPRWISAKTA